ncbi:helix-turn-helix transcriptional regulator [Variovorax sp. CCNWLW235]|uniref:helix-turn-helix transcriptional regulator n=1 Tax=Variovorax sp. CCNWLW235 TaxID=3127463 RepID=UPI00307717DC
MTAAEQIPAAELSELIGAIYDCSLDPQRWAATCEMIAQRCDSAAGGICMHDLKQTQNDQLYVFGYEPEFLQKLGARYADSPMAAADVLSNLGDVSALSMERFHLHDSGFYREVLQPHGVLDIMWFPALRTGERMASLHASRGDKSLHYQQGDLGLFKLLAPHVCRALAISDALDIQVLNSDVLKRTLDGLAAGVFLAARDGHVVYMNTAAERQVRSGTAMRLVDNRLSPVYPAARAALTQAIRDSGREGADMHAMDHAIGIPDGTGGGYVATLLPIADGRRAGVLAPFAASVAVFMQDPVQPPLMPGEAFGRLHGLTGGELRVLMALSQGLGGTEAAGMLGVGEPTIRTHLQRIYSKTGTSRQGDLLRLLHHSTPPTRHQTRLAD